MISDLPDYPAIVKLADALWRNHAKKHGAAIMVGAGFSRCSSSHVDGIKKLPLWRDFAKKLASELDSSNKDLEFSDPLRLAEEYKAYFGKTALNDLIRAEINDEAWQPKSLHQELLSLPWSEVLTTNWDTLLERAALNVHSQIYSTVSKQTDLSSSRSPRIVKLHGSIGVTEQFIVAQEDYRKYPHEFAAFVNFARQVLIENELCLLGFSGDDPNFLQWAGWVRDQLSHNARRIYLVGALNLSAAKRKFLESINVAPIDLSEEVMHIEDSDLKHQQAIKIFIETLLNLKPTPEYKWEPTSLNSQITTIDDSTRKYKDHKYAASLLKSQIDKLRKDRESYPEWLVCPADLRTRIRLQNDNPYPSPSNIAQLEQKFREQLLYEVAWQHTVTFQPVTPWLAMEFEKIANPDTHCSISKSQQLQVALLLLRTARLNDNVEDFTKWVAVLEKNALYLSDCSAEISYQQALMARDHFDYQKMESVVEKIVGEDSIWKLRQASILALLSRFEEGEILVSEAYKELLGRSRHEPNSMRIQSRLGWAHWMLNMVNLSQNFRVLDDFSNKYREMRCDPWEQISRIRIEVSDQQQKFFYNQENIEPLFEQGHYKDHSNDISFSNKVPLFNILDGMMEVVGIPFRWESVNILAGIAEQMVLSEELDGSIHTYTLAIRAAHSDNSTSIKQILSRIGLANTSQDVVNALTKQLLSALEFWRLKASSGLPKQKSQAVNIIRVYLEALARLAVRLPPLEAKKIFLLAMNIGHDSGLRHFWLHEVLSNLVKYSIQSIPDTHKSELLFDALSFPLPCEIGITDPHFAQRWPNPVIDNQSKRENNINLDKRILELIDFVIPSTPSCAFVLLRLIPLVKHGMLTKSELVKLAVKIWGEKPDYKNLPNTGLLTHALLTLPKIDSKQTSALISKLLFNAEDALFFTSTHLSGLIGAASSSESLLPNEEQALKCFDCMVLWRPPLEKNDLLEFKSLEQRNLVDDIGQALSYSITPSLKHVDITTDRFNNLIKFRTEVDSITTIVSLIYFVKLNKNIFGIVEKAIQKGIQGNTSHEVEYSTHALYKWMVLAVNKKLPPPPKSLVSKLIYLIESGRTIGLQSMLWHAGEMLKKNLLAAQHIDVLADCVPDLFENADYSLINPISREAVSASSIRETCVKLALDLMKITPNNKLKLMINLAEEDALPEVRFASLKV